MTVLCRVGDIPDGDAIAVACEVNGEALDLIVARSGQDVHCYHNECPHQGRRLDWAPGRFLVRAARITCAVHGATFEVAGGACIGGPCRGQPLAALPVRVADGEVVLDDPLQPA